MSAKRLWMTMQLFRDLFPPEVVSLISDRTVDFKFDGVTPELSEDQKIFLKETVGVERIISLKQVHGTDIVDIKEWNGQNLLFEADASMTGIKGVPLTIRTADCLPVFVYDPASGVTSLIHAGWQGTQKKVTALSVAAMIKSFGCDPKELLIGFGPCIRECCFEVDEGFMKTFPYEVLFRDDKYYLKLAYANRRQLRDVGVKDENILDCKLCTCCDDRFFSYRAQGDDAGRMISVMMLKES